MTATGYRGGMLSRVAAVLTACLLLAGCGGDEPAEPAADGGRGFNATDVAFATDMVQHHAQALTMVDLTVQREVSPELAALADRIRTAQGPEIEELTNLLEEWGEPVPETVRDHANAHGGGHAEMDSEMPGMQSQEDLDELATLSGAEFEEEWLDMMIDHHEGALEMAEVELEDGESREALRLARRVTAAQDREIGEMERLVERVEDRS